MLSKLSIALKEADETGYWLDLLKEIDRVSVEEYKSLKMDLDEIISMLVSSVKTLKDRLNSKNDIEKE